MGKIMVQKYLQYKLYARRSTIHCYAMYIKAFRFQNISAWTTCGCFSRNNVVIKLRTREAASRFRLQTANNSKKVCCIFRKWNFSQFFFFYSFIMKLEENKVCALRLRFAYVFLCLVFPKTLSVEDSHFWNKTNFKLNFSK